MRLIRFILMLFAFSDLQSAFTANCSIGTTCSGYVNLLINSQEILLDELQQKDVRSAISSLAGTSLDLQATVEAHVSYLDEIGGSINVSIESNVLSEKQCSAIAHATFQYLDGRARGFSSNLILEGFAERVAPDDSLLGKRMRAVADQYNWMPLRRLKELRKDEEYVLVDKDIALIIRFASENNNVVFSEWKVDSQEFEESARKKIDQVRDELKKDRKVSFGHGEMFDDELKKQLWERFQIRWRGRKDLMPGLILD